MKAIVLNTAFAACFFLAAGTLGAQQASARHPDMRSNSLYTEIGGNIGDFSVNYDRLIGKATLVRIGYGTLSDTYGDCFGIGLVSACEGSVNASLVGLTVGRLFGRRHMAEIGAGGAFGTVTEERISFIGASTSEKETVTTVTATIGYRWQGTGRMLMRAGFTPSYVVSGETENYPKGLAYSIGASLGFAF
ncbi:MAG TPA: hypothetical protein VMY38_04575 [Gemmatimonadaceae bacterium]|nr:hypothetical protein [Gemmatimonadaceae bacterium]